MTPDEISKLIPDEVVEAARDALFSDKGMRGAIAAGLAAWPGMDTIMLPRMTKPGEFAQQDYIRLPLTENPDDKA